MSSKTVSNVNKWSLLVALLAIAAGIAMLLTATQASGQPAARKDGSLRLVAYSTPREAYAELVKAFNQTPAGAGTSVSQSYGGSGEQARAVRAGLKADIVAFSLAPDMKEVADAGIVRTDWNKDRFGGMVTKSVVVWVVRKGNPKKIKTWDDLTKKGVSVITANPFTSGGARWNVMAAYGAQLKQGKTPKQARDYLARLFKNVAVQDKSARESLQTFAQGKGDVLIAYENEAIQAQRANLPVEYIIPKYTIVIENPIAITKKSENADTALAFMNFVRSAKGQAIFVKYGYRPVLAGVKNSFKTPAGVFTIREKAIGGWLKVSKQFFDPKTGYMVKLSNPNG